MAVKQGFVMYYTKGISIGTEVSVHYRGSGRLSGVVIKSGSTIINLGMYESDEMVTCYIDIDNNDGNLFHSS